MKKLLILTLLFALNAFAQESEKKEQSVNLNTFSDKVKTEFKRMRDKLDVTAKKVRERLSIEGGPGGTIRKVNAFNNTEDSVVGMGFNTRFSYTINHHWEFGVSSYIYFGKSEDLEFRIGNNTVLSQGVFRSVAFAPTMKYTTDWQVAKDWHVAFQVGPAWSIQTLKLKSFTNSSGDIKQNFKYTYEARGGVIGIGLEEVLPFKQMNPAYVEFLYGYMKGYKSSLVDASDFTEVDTVSSEERSIDIDGDIFMLNFGLLIF